VKNRLIQECMPQNKNGNGSVVISRFRDINCGPEIKIHRHNPVFENNE
jgi:hypothetical protein